jgi:hypothetical protein
MAVSPLLLAALAPRPGFSLPPRQLLGFLNASKFPPIIGVRGVPIYPPFDPSGLPPVDIHRPPPGIIVIPKPPPGTPPITAFSPLPPWSLRRPGGSPAGAPRIRFLYSPRRGVVRR